MHEVVKWIDDNLEYDRMYHDRARGVQSGWLHYASTTAPGSIWIAGVSEQGPWLLSLDHSGVVAEIGALPASPARGPGRATFMLASLTDLHGALDRVYKLAMSLPEAPLDRFI